MGPGLWGEASEEAANQGRPGVRGIEDEPALVAIERHLHRRSPPKLLEAKRCVADFFHVDGVVSEKAHA